MKLSEAKRELLMALDYAGERGVLWTSQLCRLSVWYAAEDAGYLLNNRITPAGRAALTERETG